MLNKSLYKEIRMVIDDCYIFNNKIITNITFIKQSMQENIHLLYKMLNIIYGTARFQ